MLDALNITSILIFLVLLFISIAFHETMHAVVSYKLGDDLAKSHGRITLNPLRHIDPFLTLFLPFAMLLLGMSPILAAKPVPINTNRISGDEWGLAAVGLTGPVSNLFLASVGAVLIGLITPTGLLADILKLFVQLNVGLFAFNMLPIPPLDGSRLLYAIAPPSVQSVMEKIEQMGIFITLMFIFLLLPLFEPLLISVNNFFLTFFLG